MACTSLIIAQHLINRKWIFTPKRLHSQKFYQKYAPEYFGFPNQVFKWQIKNRDINGGKKTKSKKAYEPCYPSATSDLKISSHPFLQCSLETIILRIQTQKVTALSQVSKSPISIYHSRDTFTCTGVPTRQHHCKATGLLTIGGDSIGLSRLWVRGVGCSLLHSCSKLCLPICSHSLWGRGRKNMWVWSAICQKWQKIESPCIRWKHAR